MSNVIPLRRGRSKAPPSHGLIHVFSRGDHLELMHESASGTSFATLAIFQVDQRGEAIGAALEALPTYAPCRLGEVPTWA